VTNDKRAPKSSPPYEGGVAAFRGLGGSLTGASNVADWNSIPFLRNSPPFLQKTEPLFSRSCTVHRELLHRSPALSPELSLLFRVLFFGIARSSSPAPSSTQAEKSRFPFVVRIKIAPLAFFSFGNKQFTNSSSSTIHRQFP